jgi:uncharacterized protein
LIKKKIINDPVYGFIDIPHGIIFKLIEHPWFQRLRRIKQLGLTDLVYPGALHTRFHHALGAMHLMNEALQNLKSKGIKISPGETEAAMIAILLHDIGHGPFSHTLENSLLKRTKHEEISLMIIRRLNDEFRGRLDQAISIFTHQHPKKFLSQLVSSQLDVDRLDYLNRDSFFTGVNEGTIGTERILKMLNVINNELVVEEKAIYSIENFLSARRLMYWQVYLHKATIGAEQMLLLLVNRAKKLARDGKLEDVNENIAVFLGRDVSIQEFIEEDSFFDKFMELDDYDIWGQLKKWVTSDDRVLSELSKMLIYRKLFQVKLSNTPVDIPSLPALIKALSETYHISLNDAGYMVTQGNTSNAAYIVKGMSINVLMKTGKILDITDAVDLPNIKAMSKIVRKYYLCWPKSVSL